MKRSARKPIERSSTRETKRYTTKGKGLTGPAARRWYDEPEGDCHEAVFQHVESVKQRQIRRRYELAVFQQMYCNTLQNVFAGSSLFSATVSTALTAYSRISVNVVKACVDTATARIAKSKPRAFILPNKGDYRLKRKARLLTKFCDGVMQASSFYQESEDMFRDAALYGDGNIGCFLEDGEPKARCLKIDEVIVEQVDGMYDDPQEIHWDHPTSRTELLARYPEHAKEIEEARLFWRGAMAFMSQKDLVRVIHTWRKPSTKGAKDGRHTVTICNATLVDERYDKDYLPILRFHWTAPTYGPFGTGIALELEGLQWTITNVMRDLAESIHKFAVPRIFVDSLSGLSQHMINNEVGAVIKCDMSRAPPAFVTPPAAPTDVYQYLQWLIDQGFKQEGLSQLSAQSEKPAGLNSGVAMRTYQDVETQRFSIVGQRWERLYQQAARIFIDLASDAYKDAKALSVKVPGRGFIETIEWSKVSMKEDQYDLAVWSTNILPETPEGKLQMVQEYVNSGFMPKDVALGQMRLPVLNDWIDDELAARDQIERALSSIIDDADYVAPDEVGNLDLALSMAQAAYLRAPEEKLEPHKVELLVKFMDATMAAQAKKRAQQMAPPPPGPGAPGAAPGAGPAVGQAPPPPPAPLAAAGSGPVQMPTAAAA